MRRFLPLLIIVSAFFRAASAWGGDDGVSANVSVDKARVFVGDRLKFTIEVNCRGSHEINFPDFADNKIGGFEIKDSGSKKDSGIFGNIRFKRWYYLASYSVGKRQIPELGIKYRVNRANEWKGVQTRPLNITVESVLPQGKLPQDIMDVKGPLSYFEINRFSAIAALFICCTIGAFIYFKFRGRKAPIRLPHETALEELEATRGRFMSGSDVAEYYAGTSDCVRRYIERAFSLRAPEMTTEEFLSSLRESSTLSLDQKDPLKGFLNACDLVKFARYAPAIGEMESVYLAARKFIEETRGAGSDANV